MGLVTVERSPRGKYITIHNDDYTVFVLERDSGVSLSYRDDEFRDEVASLRFSDKAFFTLVKGTTSTFRWIERSVEANGNYSLFRKAEGDLREGFSKLPTDIGTQCNVLLDAVVNTEPLSLSRELLGDTIYQSEPSRNRARRAVLKR